MHLKTLLKKIPLIHTLGKALKSGVRDIPAIGNYMAERQIRRNGPIRVGFLCQYLPIWHKLQPIYEKMRSDERFAPVLICVPSGIRDGELIDPNDNTNDTLDYFTRLGYSEALNAMLGDGEWLDLKALALDYVFYPRPYNSYMPKGYWCNEISRYSKLCMVLYGMNTTKEVVDTTLNRDFFKYVYCYIAELPYSKTSNEKKGWLLHKLGLQHSIYHGMPGIEALYAAQSQPRPAWDFSKNDFKVLWTPRWTTDLSMGGTNFFTYYQFLLDYARGHTDVDFLFRPHPLALSHFLETGEMTQQEVDSFHQQCESLANVSLDREKEYAATFWGTSVMISDISGMIPEYFITGKPLIFCASNMVLTPEDNTGKILQASYIVHNEQELSQCLSQLRQGIDPLAEKRRQTVRELFGDALNHHAQSVVEHLALHSARNEREENL